MMRRKFPVILLLTLAVFFAGESVRAENLLAPESQTLAADKYVRTELYFGMNKKDGGKVSEADWNEFLESEVTPRFPAGFTVLEGYGQYRDSNSEIVREASRVLVLFYPKKERAAVNPKIEELRAAYKKRFEQESVLRLDFRQSVAVSF